MKPRLLVFSAHAADFCSRAGGTIAKAVASGCAVHVVDASYGELGESPRIWAETASPAIEHIKHQRSEEAKRSASILGCSIEFLDFGDNPMVLTAKREQRLFEILAKNAPDIVLTHWRDEPFNRDHAILTRAVIDAAHFLRCGGRVPEQQLRTYPQILMYEPTVYFTDLVDFHPTHYIDISAHWPQKLLALEALCSQPDLVPDYTLYGAYRGHQARGISGKKEVEMAEAFVRLQPIIADPWRFIA